MKKALIYLAYLLLNLIALKMSGLTEFFVESAHGFATGWRANDAIVVRNPPPGKRPKLLLRQG